MNTTNKPWHSQTKAYGKVCIYKNKTVNQEVCAVRLASLNL